MPRDFRRLLVSIRTSGTATPVHLVHSLAGELTWLPPLARLLDSARPVYGFAAPGLNAEGPPFGSIQEMAAGYLAAARSAQPHGPYIFGGFSFGGVVAYEMARQAMAAGEAVAHLVLIDAYTPKTTVVATLQDWANDGALLQTVGNSLATDWRASELIAPGTLAPHDPDAQVDAVTRHLLRHCRVPHSYEALASLLRRCLDVMQAHTRMLAAYGPGAAPVAMDAILIHGSKGFLSPENPLRLPPIPAAAEDRDYGWSGFLADPPRRAAVETEHFLMMREPALSAVAGIIESHLTR